MGEHDERGAEMGAWAVSRVNAGAEKNFRLQYRAGVLD